METIALIFIILLGYFHLLRVTKKKSIMGSVKIHVEALDNTKEVSLDNKYELYTKRCPFLVTPVPGMEFTAAGVVEALIKRVIIDDYGYLEVVCHAKVSSDEDEFKTTCECLESEGWHKNVFV